MRMTAICGKVCVVNNEHIISLKTVLGHRTKIMEKLDLHNRAELIKYAIRKGLIIVDDKVG